jgi:hypothetical protein
MYHFEMSTPKQLFDQKHNVTVYNSSTPELVSTILYVFVFNICLQTVVRFFLFFKESLVILGLSL